jgi:hypothetical protein
MVDLPWLWAAFTIVAAASQTARNAMQRELIVTLGTLGATHVRFLFGFPLALLMLAGVLVFTGMTLPRPALAFWPWVLAGTVTQILATALMLAAMGERSFVVAIAYIKTEPVQVAVFGFLVLGDALTVPMVIAILIATVGVVAMSFKPRGGAKADALPTLLGLGSGAMFALSAVTYRGGILSLEGTPFLMAATFRWLSASPRRRASSPSTSRCVIPSCSWPSSRHGGLRCSPAPWVRWPLNFGSWPLRWRVPRACARSGLSRFCSPRRSRASCSNSQPRAARQPGSCWWWPGSRCWSGRGSS